MLSPALIEEFIADTDNLMRSFETWAGRWTKYGEQLEHSLSESQREDIMKSMNRLSKLIENSKYDI